MTDVDFQGLIAEPFLPDADGYVRLPDKPGLGIELGDRWQRRVDAMPTSTEAGRRNRWPLPCREQAQALRTRGVVEPRIEREEPYVIRELALVLSLGRQRPCSCGDICGMWSQ